MKLSHSSHSPWKSIQNVDSHITHRTTTTTHYDDKTALQKQRRYRFAPTDQTTLSLDLAVTSVQKGHKAAVLDVDPQATASKWTDRRTEELPWVVPTHAVRLGAVIEQAKAQGVDFIVIDTPPHSSTDAAEAARRADVVVSPVEPHLFGLETVSKLADLLRVAGDPPSFFVVNKAPTQGTEGANAVEYIKQKGFKVCPTVIHLRAAHRHASNIGKTAVEYEGDSKAAQETLQLYVYTLKLVSTQRLTDTLTEQSETISESQTRSHSTCRKLSKR